MEFPTNARYVVALYGSKRLEKRKLLLNTWRSTDGTMLTVSKRHPSQLKVVMICLDTFGAWPSYSSPKWLPLSCLITMARANTKSKLQMPTQDHSYVEPLTPRIEKAKRSIHWAAVLAFLYLVIYFLDLTHIFPTSPDPMSSLLITIEIVDSILTFILILFCYKALRSVEPSA